MSSLKLAHTPLPGSLHVYLNGIEQFEPADWSYVDSPPRVVFQAAMDVRAEDLVEARYAYTDPTTYATTHTVQLLITNPDDALPNCGGGTFPWQNGDGTFPEYHFESSSFGVALAAGDMVDVSVVIDSFVGRAGDTSYGFDAWLYFRKADGCIEIYNWLSGTLSTTGYATSLDLGPVPVAGGRGNISVGSVLVASSWNAFSYGAARQYREEPV